MNFLLLRSLFSLAISFLLTLYLVPKFRALAVRLQFLDTPDGKIKKHETVTPYLGGLAVYMGFLGALALTFPFANQVLLFFIGATLLLFIGLLDDLVAMQPHQKFLGQIVATFCFLKAGLHLKEQFFYNYWNIPISFLWILIVINAFNLVDVMDGLAATIAMCSGSMFFALALYFNEVHLALLLACFLGAVAGFFYYNRPKASIYLGDAGSLFIGGFLAIVPFLFKWGVYTPYGWITPLIVLAIPLLEISALILIRTYKGIPFYRASPDHFSLYLQGAGWSKCVILIYVAMLSLILAVASSFFITNFIGLPMLIILGIFFLGVWIIVLLAAKARKQ